MKKAVLVAIFAVSLIANLVLFAFGKTQALSANPLPSTPPISQGYFYAHSVTENMTLEEKIGQLLIISIPNSMITDTNKNIIKTIKPGGIILFAVNIASENQMQNYTSGLQEIAQENNIPKLFIAVDEEGGEVERINFDPVPLSQQELGSINNEETTRQTASATAQKLDNLGFNVNFAPVTDIAWPGGSIMYYRSFGDNPEIVSQHATWMIDEFSKNNIIGTAKHFPGHGRTMQDSHIGLPVIDISKEEWQATDALPFQAAIDTGVKMIMVGHLYFPQVDSQMASQSSVWINDILRNEMGYKGIVITDDIKMGGVEEDPATAVVNMIAAGNDMAIAAVNTEILDQVVANLINYYSQENRIADLDTKVVRIEKVKWEMLNK